MNNPSEENNESQHHLFADLLDFSPFTFYKGINQKRLLRGLRSDLNK